MKECTRCHATQALTQFGVMKGGRRHSHCRGCRVELARIWQKSHPERVQAYKGTANANRKRARAADPNTREKDWKSWISREYGMSAELYATMLNDQGGKCAICRCEDTGHAKQKRLHIDHDHLTGTVRGLLCVRCNSLLGYARDSVSVLIKAIAYLDNSGKVE